MTAINVPGVVGNSTIPSITVATAPVVVGAGSTTSPFSAISVNGLDIGDNVVGYGFSGTLALTLHEIAGPAGAGNGLVSDLSTPGSYTFINDTFTSSYAAGPGVPNVYGPQSILQQLIYQAPELSSGQTETIEVTGRLTYSAGKVYGYPAGTTVTPNPLFLVITAPPVTPVILGAGPDALTLAVSEDAYQGNAQFTICVDGVQQGGTQTATAAHGVTASQDFTVYGSFGTGPHTVKVDFLNDNGLYGSMDRNLYVDGATINGAAIGSSRLTEYTSGPQSFNFDGGLASTSPPVTLGTGPDALTLAISEDAYQGDAQFTVSVDGVQQGGIQTSIAAHGGNAQTFTVNGAFSTGTHAVTVDFLNDNGGYGATDRNLYVDGATLNGAAISGSALQEYVNGPQSFSFTGSGSSAPPPPPDTLTVALTEDAYQGDAIASIALDGVTIGQPTVLFLNSGSASDEFSFTGNFGGTNTTHDLAVSFLNDNGGYGVTDRNLYVRGATFDGVSHSFAAPLYTDSTVHFNIAAITQT